MFSPILHIPHASTTIPFAEGYVVSMNTLDQEILKLTDWYTDDLFAQEDSIVVKADFSRIFCDVERFADDKQEIMAQKGMGVLYEKADNGSVIRYVNPALRSKILENFYWPHHKRLNQEVNEQLQSHGKALIIDGHSFPSTPFVRDLDQTPDRPDFNIGTDPYHTPDNLVEASNKFFHEKGYSLGINRPYSGSIVPMEHYRSTRAVQSIMLEVNRALYLEEPSNRKSHNYDQIKMIVGEYLELITKTFNET
jgi:N-formylglutamate amidohydrolase